MLSRAVAGMLVMALALAGGAAFADTTWSGTTSTDFEVGTNWVGGSAPADDTTTDVAVLSGGVPGNQPELSKSRSVKGLNFLSGGWDIFSSAGTVHTLSLGSYGVRNDPSGTNVVGDKAVLSISDANTMMQTDNGYLDVKAKITGSGGLKFYGLRGDGNQRYMHLRGDNDFTGASNLTRSAWVRLYHANALGTAANTITVQGQSGYRREARLYLAGSAGGLNANKYQRRRRGTVPSRPGDHPRQHDHPLRRHVRHVEPRRQRGPLPHRLHRADRRHHQHHRRLAGPGQVVPDRRDQRRRRPEDVRLR
ncbi:MAG: hypothetical protein R6V58_16235 [Planctomycetota bacterium]